MAGLSAEGFEIKTTEEILAETVAESHETIDPALDLSEEQPLGQAYAIQAKKNAEIWELCQSLANGMNPGGAENFLLDNISALTGTYRRRATKTKVTLDCNVNDNFSAPARSIQTNVAGHDERFVNVGAVGPLTPAGVYPIEFECTEYGPVNVFADTLKVITAPVTGLNSVTNPKDGIPGRFDEKDESLRQRREDERASTGSSSVDSIRADVLQVSGVEQCFVFENVLLTTDANGLPGKSIEVVIYDGITPAASNSAVAQVIWNGKPSGAETVGNTTVIVDDATGADRAVKFSRATIKNVYMSADVLVDPNFFPANGATLIKEALAAHGDAYQNLSVDVFAVRYKAQALRVQGVLDVTALRLGFAASPTNTANLTITGREIADLDTSRITVNVTSGSP